MTRKVYAMKKYIIFIIFIICIILCLFFRFTPVLAEPAGGEEPISLVETVPYISRDFVFDGNTFPPEQIHCQETMNGKQQEYVLTRYSFIGCDNKVIATYRIGQFP